MAEINLTQLPAPKAIEEFSFEQIFARKKAALIALCPDSTRAAIAAALELESEPLTIDLQQQAYQELLLRQRINEATAANMLALATGSDLDHIAARAGLERKLITPAKPEADPPAEAIWETDKALRRRVQLHPEKYAAAGPGAAYVAHAIDAHADVADARAARPVAGTVRVFVKSHSGIGVPSAAVLAAVQNYLSGEERRPLCDTVEVRAGSAKSIAISYKTTFEDGPDKALVAAQQRADLEAVLAEHRGLGVKLALSKIIGALDVVGAQKVELQSPTADIVCADGEFIRVTAITATEAV